MIYNESRDTTSLQNTTQSLQQIAKAVGAKDTDFTAYSVWYIRPSAENTPTWRSYILKV